MSTQIEYIVNINENVDANQTKNLILDALQSRFEGEFEIRHELADGYALILSAPWEADDLIEAVPGVDSVAHGDILARPTLYSEHRFRYKDIEDGQPVVRALISNATDLSLHNRMRSPVLVTARWRLTGDGVYIYVVDSAVADIPQYDFGGIIHNPNNWTPSASNSQGQHGTWVASCAGGKDVGIAPDSIIYSAVGFPGDGSSTTSSTLVAAIDAARAHFVANHQGTANAVVNCSFESTATGTISDPYASVINACRNVGLPVVAAAGNGNKDLQVNFSAFPAESINTFTSQAMQVSERPTWFTNYNTGKTWTNYTLGERCAAFDPNNDMDFVNGTSFSSPYTAGTIARLLQLVAPMTTATEVDALFNYLAAQSKTGRVAGRTGTDAVLYLDPELWYDNTPAIAGLTFRGAPTEPTRAVPRRGGNLSAPVVSGEAGASPTGHRYWRIYITDNNGDVNYTVIGELEFREFVGGSDITTPDGTAMASSEAGTANTAAKAFDNVSTSSTTSGDHYWSTASGSARVPSWVGYDFGDGNEKIIEEVTLFATREVNRIPKDFSLQYSDDGANWTDKWVVTGQTGWAIGETRTFSSANAIAPIPPPAYRFWRVRSTDTHIAGDYMACADLQLRETVDGADLTTPTTLITASAVASTTYAAAKAIDDDLATFWTSGATAPGANGHWIYVDFGLGNEKDINEISYRVRPDSYREDPANLFIEYSSDGVTWTEKWNALSIPAWTSGETRAFVPDSVVEPSEPAPDPSGGFRYWRIYIEDSADPASAYIGLEEIEFRDTIGGADLTNPADAATRAISSSEYDTTGHKDDNAFNDLTGTNNLWATLAGGKPAWIGWDFGDTDKKSIKEVVITGRTGNYAGQSPGSIRLEYSSDGATWHTLYDFGQQSAWKSSSQETRTFADYEQIMLFKEAMHAVLHTPQDKARLTKASTHAVLNLPQDKGRLNKINTYIVLKP